MARSRFGWVPYLFLFFLLLAIGGVVFAVVKDVSAPASQKMQGADSMRMVGAFILLLVLAYIFSRLAIVVRITPSQIIIKNLLKRKTIERDSITSIDLFGESKIFIISNAIRISLTKGKDIVITDSYYRNEHELRQALNDHFKEKIKDHCIPASPKTRSQWHSEKFAGNFHTSDIGGWLYIVLAANIALLFTKDMALVFAGCIMSLLFFLATTLQAYYFVLDGSDLVIRHHMFSWINRRYALADILFIKFQKPLKHSDSAIIFTRDFRGRSYAGSSLRSKHWIALKDALHSAGIPIKTVMLS